MLSVPGTRRALAAVDGPHKRLASKRREARLRKRRARPFFISRVQLILSRAARALASG
jgi:hypothetical protein